MIQNDDLLFVVDENNNPLTPQAKPHVHEKNLWHRTAHIWVVNKKKQLLCHQRGVLKNVLPNNWVPYFGDHFGPITSYKNGALTELKREAGLLADEDDLQLYRIYKDKTRHEFQGIFIYRWDGNIEMLSYATPDVAQLKWFPLKDIKTLLAEKATDWSQTEYVKQILDWLMKHGK